MERKHAYDVIIIGGGATGAGVARDAAMREFKTLLIERGDIGSGTSGRYHGLLHSGARYAIGDPESAKECIEENLILKKIAKHAIDDTGGLFLTTADDDPSYADGFLKACEALGIPIEELTPAKALQEEPFLHPDIQRVFTVPDAVCDSQKLIMMNIQSAREYGAAVLTNTEVTGFVIQQESIQAVRIRNIRTGLESIIDCQFVINAAGVWAGHIADMAGIPIALIASKGSMAVIKGRLVNKVLNRCRPAGDGDILVPKGQTSIIGTTSVAVKDPNHISTDPGEKIVLLREGDKMIKDFSKHTLLYTYAGVRPLFADTKQHDENRKISRTFTLKNHKTTDSLTNMVTILGGKLTTYRAMAQAAVDAMCGNLEIKRVCTTMREPLPSADVPRRKSIFSLPHIPDMSKLTQTSTQKTK